MSYNSAIPRERERDLQRDRYVDRDREREVYRDESYDRPITSSGSYPVPYERTVRREYRERGDSLFDFISLHKFLISAVILGLILAASMHSRDIDGDYYRDRGLLRRTSDGISSLGDKFSDTFHYLENKILHRPTMQERASDKARMAAWEAKNKMQGGFDSISSSAAAARDKVNDGLSYLSDKFMHSADDARHAARESMTDSKGMLRRARDRAYELGRDAQDRVYGSKDRLYDVKDRMYDMKDRVFDAKDRVMDDYDHNLRKGARRLRRQVGWGSSRWSFGDRIAEHPVLSALLGIVIFLTLKSLFSHKSDSMSPRRPSLTGLALVMERFF